MKLPSNSLEIALNHFSGVIDLPGGFSTKKTGKMLKTDFQGQTNAVSGSCLAIAIEKPGIERSIVKTKRRLPK